MKNRVFAAAAAVLLLTAAVAFANDITVIFSGETHAMLHSCDCPDDDPGGGLAERAAFLGGVVASPDNLLLLDGGGFSGGGIYDTYSTGRAEDSVRTVKTIAAMGLMGYDAVGIGDDDLRYGGRWLVDRARQAKLPLVCANCFTADGRRLTDPYVIVKKGNNTFAITSVVTNEHLFPTDTSIVIRDPLASLESIRRDMRRKSNYQILLSHLGEAETDALLRRAPGFLLAANGHRKISVQPVTNMSRTPTLQFGFQGKSLSYAVLSWQNRGLRVSRSGWFRIDGGGGRDERVAEIVYEPRPEPGEPPPQIREENKVYDLYIMSRCVYGLRALGEIAELIRAFPQREWNVWFIGTAEGDTLRSLGGEAEMFDEKLWLGVKALYPFRYHEFLFMRTTSELSTEALLEEMRFDVEKIRYWVDDMGSSELRRHYQRSMGLNVSASPALFINNKLFDRPIGGGRLVREECRAAEVEPPFCNDYPECFEDTDCWQPGKIGRCVSEEEEGGRTVCEFRDDASFALTVLIADSAVGSPERQPVELVRELMSGARINIVKLSTDEGRAVMAGHSPRALPYFHFDGNVANAHRFSEISEMLTAIGGNGGGFTLKRGVIAENYFPQREEKQGLIELYADPLMPDIGNVINILLASPDIARRIVLRPAVLTDPRDANPSAQDRQRAEEALRWLVLAEEFPDRYMPYLRIYADNPGSTLWFNWLKRLRINRKRFMRRLEANQQMVAAHWENVAPVFSGEPVMILINNRAKIAVTNERELERALKSIYY